MKVLCFSLVRIFVSLVLRVLDDNRCSRKNQVEPQEYHALINNVYILDNAAGVIGCP